MEEAMMETKELERTDLADVPIATAFAGPDDRACGSDGRSCAPLFGLPGNAEVTIYQPAKSAMTSGRAGTRRWVLEFEPRSPLFIEPLMGWTGSADPLRQVRLTFSTREAAIAYARRQGLRFTIREPHQPRLPLRPYADNFPAVPLPRATFPDWTRAPAALPRLDDARQEAAVAGQPAIPAKESRVQAKPSRLEGVMTALPVPSTTGARIGANAANERASPHPVTADTSLAA
jgi:hypothetical protein